MFARYYVINSDHPDIEVQDFKILYEGEELISGGFDSDVEGVFVVGEELPNSEHYINPLGFRNRIREFPRSGCDGEFSYYNYMLSGFSEMEVNIGEDEPFQVVISLAC